MPRGSPPPPLPIDPFVPAIVAAVRTRRALVVTAAPGAGKTTRVSPALTADGPVLLLQPRRVAARAIARRIAIEQGWTVGQEVGWQVRFEQRFTSATRLLVATEGILTARLQDDPLAGNFRTIIIDEFHERSLHADVGLALAKQAWLARDDLAIVVMSATIDAARVAAFLGDCPVIEVPGRLHPLEIDYQPGIEVHVAAAASASATRGAVLCFLPGAPEIRRAAERLRPLLPGHVAIHPLHGGLDALAQDLAIAPGGPPGPRVILATNLAETTVTVPDVVAVVDTGLHKVARYDPARVIDSLETERIAQDSADQRAGRAGRTGPGRVTRLWDSRDRLRPHREPDIARVDLASALLDLLAWGSDGRTFDWFERPPEHALEAAFGLLTRLGAVNAAGALTALGRLIRRLPVHPRLARILIDAGGTMEAARAAALLSLRHSQTSRPTSTTSCDLLAAVDRPAAEDVERVARDLRSHVLRVLDAGSRAPHDESKFRRAVLAAYPDRVAWRRAPRSDRVLLASGAGARLGRESGVVDAEFMVGVDVTATGRPGDEPTVRIATGIDREWITPTHDELRHELTADGAPRAWRVLRYDAIPLREEPARVDPAVAADLIAAEYLKRPPEQDAELLRRVRFAGHDIALDVLVRQAASGARRLDDLRLEPHLPDVVRRVLDRHAPTTLRLPKGRVVRLRYDEAGRVTASVKLQDVFGLRETPRLGPARVPVTFELLAPSGRPVQITTDLGSFWAHGYGEVRKELRARYPKHQWPEVPG